MKKISLLLSGLSLIAASALISKKPDNHDSGTYLMAVSMLSAGFYVGRLIYDPRHSGL